MLRGHVKQDTFRDVVHRAEGAAKAKGIRFHRRPFAAGRLGDIPQQILPPAPVAGSASTVGSASAQKPIITQSAAIAQAMKESCDLVESAGTHDSAVPPNAEHAIDKSSLSGTRPRAVFQSEFITPVRKSVAGSPLGSKPDGSGVSNDGVSEIGGKKGKDKQDDLGRIRELEESFDFAAFLDGKSQGDKEYHLRRFEPLPTRERAIQRKEKLEKRIKGSQTLHKSYEALDDSARFTLFSEIPDTFMDIGKAPLFCKRVCDATIKVSEEAEEKVQTSVAWYTYDEDSGTCFDPFKPRVACVKSTDEWKNNVSKAFFIDSVLCPAIRLVTDAATAAEHLKPVADAIFVEVDPDGPKIPIEFDDLRKAMLASSAMILWLLDTSLGSKPKATQEDVNKMLRGQWSDDDWNAIAGASGIYPHHARPSS